MYHSIRAGAAVAALVALAGCTTVGPDFHRPAAPQGAAAQRYDMPGDPAAPAVVLAARDATPSPWWRAFGSPELDQLVQAALARSPSVEEAEAVLARSQAQLAAERGGALPQANLSSQARRTRINTASFGFPGFPSRTLDIYSLEGLVTYDLDLFGGQRRRVEAASARVAADRARAEAARLSLAGNVTLQLLRAAALQAQIAEIRAMVAGDRRMITMIQRAQAAGGATRSDLSILLVQLAEDESLLPPLEQRLASARHQVALLSGRAPAETPLPDVPLSAIALRGVIPIDVPSELVRRRPDIQAAEAELHVATAAVGVATADQYPSLRLSADLTQTALHPDEIFKHAATGWNVGAALAAPLFDGGVRRARRKAAEADLRVARARYQQTVLRAFVQVSDALAALAADQHGIESINRAVAAAEVALRDAETDFREGGGPLIDVIRAQRTLNRARQAKVEIEGRRLADLVELHVAVAADWRVA